MRMMLGRKEPLREYIVTLTTWWYKVPCAANYRSRPRVSWLCLPGTYRGRRPSFGGTGFRSWQGAVTLGALYGKKQIRHGGWERRLRDGRTWRPPWLGRRIDTRRPPKRACRSPFNRSETLCSVSPQAYGWLFRRWRMSCGTHSSWPSFTGTRTRSPGGRSLVWRSNIIGLTSLTLIRLRERTGQRPES